MRRSSFTDREGRQWAVDLPEGVPDSDAPLGVPAGPPPLDELRLPLDTEVRLHNELFARGILTHADARWRANEIFAALQSAFKVDTQRIIEHYGLTEAGPGA